MEENEEGLLIVNEDEDLVNTVYYKDKRLYKSKLWEKGKRKFHEKKHQAHTVEELLCFNCNETRHFACNCSKGKNQLYRNTIRVIGNPKILKWM